MVEINLVAVLLATIASMVVGSVWYAPPVLGKTWMKLAKLNQKDMESAGWRPIVVSIVTCAVMAYVLAHFTYLAYNFYQLDYSFLSTALFTALWVWIGFIGLRFLTHDSFESRPYKLTTLNAAHELVTLLAMALVIGYMGI